MGLLCMRDGGTLLGDVGFLRGIQFGTTRTEYIQFNVQIKLRGNLRGYMQLGV